MTTASTCCSSLTEGLFSFPEYHYTLLQNAVCANDGVQFNDLSECIENLDAEFQEDTDNAEFVVSFSCFLFSHLTLLNSKVLVFLFSVNSAKL